MTAHYYKLLWIVSAGRDKFQGQALEDGVSVPEWVQRERILLRDEVNKERARRGLPLIGDTDIKRGEVVGDPCYGKRLAEHCAGLAVGE